MLRIIIYISFKKVFLQAISVSTFLKNKAKLPLKLT